MSQVDQMKNLAYVCLAVALMHFVFGGCNMVVVGHAGACALMQVTYFLMALRLLGIDVSAIIGDGTAIPSEDDCVVSDRVMSDAHHAIMVLMALTNGFNGVNQYQRSQFNKLWRRRWQGRGGRTRGSGGYGTAALRNVHRR
jgi:hypothetical protein